MNDNQPPIMPIEPESLPNKSKSDKFWQSFWFTFLVVSLSYAWHSFYAPCNRIDWVLTIQRRGNDSTLRPHQDHPRLSSQG